MYDSTFFVTYFPKKIIIIHFSNKNHYPGIFFEVLIFYLPSFIADENPLKISTLLVILSVNFKILFFKQILFCNCRWNSKRVVLTIPQSP
jgi:hypothetical protein